MTKNCPNCGAPIKKYQKECAYCGSEIESSENRPDNEYVSIAPYGGKIGAQIKIPWETAKEIEGRCEGNLDRYAKAKLLERMSEEIKEHIEVWVRDSDSFMDDFIIVKGTLWLGAIPGKEICPLSNVKTQLY